MNRTREQLADLERFVSQNIKPDHDVHPDLLWDAAEMGHYELPGRLSQSGHAEVWSGEDLTSTRTEDAYANAALEGCEKIV